MPTRARFRFYAELNDFLPEELHHRTVERAFDVPPTVKDAIEGLGVPHTEVDLIVVEGRSVDFSHVVREGELISVYPMFESLEISPVIRLRPEPLRDTRFVADANLGQLARYLRLLGFDTLYRNDFEDAEIATISVRERRVLLTRDVGVLRRKEVTHGYFVRADVPRLQVIEVVTRFDLFDRLDPLARCANCNGELISVPKEEVAHRLQAGTRATYDDFRTCTGCGQIYWKGAHHVRIAELVDAVLTARPSVGGE
ncbi:MAG: Mut7-C RNAse domain-containing protein [Actinomycetota bacterium]